jgi:ubiquitin-conjugating enzyme (huntingtin interacting protein 2)
MLIRNPAEFERRRAQEGDCRGQRRCNSRVDHQEAPGSQAERREGQDGSVCAQDYHKVVNFGLHKDRYHGYNKDLVDRFVAMGFDVEAVVGAFEYVGIDKMGGEDYELEEAYMGDITARLFGEA